MNSARPSITLFCAAFVAFTGCSDDAGGDDAAVEVAPDTSTDIADSASDDADSADALEEALDSADTRADSGDSGETGDVGPTPEAALEATIDAWCPGYASRWCSAAFGRCGCDLAPGFPDETTCRASFEARCRNDLSSYLEVAQGGQAVFHPEVAPDCLNVLGALIDGCLLLPNDLFFIECPILQPPGGFVDLPGDGAACQGTCALGLRCGSDGLCQVPGSVGASCRDLADCGPELVCQGATEESAGTCQSPDFSLAGNSCASPDDCGGDTNCMASLRKVCIEPAAGRPCRYDNACRDGEFCVFGPDQDTGTCTPVPGAGEPCGNGTYCADGLGCDMQTNNCAALPGAGEACALGSTGPFLCAPGLGCLDGVCGTLPALDEPCAIGAPSCADGLGCAFEPEGSFCREPVGAGGVCQNDATCKTGFFCDFGTNTCAASQAPGTPCSDGNECGDGVCVPDATFTFRCAPRSGVGGECFLEDCADGLRCETPYTQGACVPAVFCRSLRF